MAETRRTVLVVEDDADLRRMYRTALTLAGFVVREASDGHHALYDLDQHRPDVIVLDIMLPTISGIAVQQELAAGAYTRHIPIVVVTGAAIGPDLDVACMLRKPVTPDELVIAVQKCLAAGASSAGL